MGSRPPEFDETASSWDAYRVRLEAYFEGNHITYSSKRRALLVASLSDSVVRVIQGRCPSTPVNSLTYEEVANVLEEHYSPQQVKCLQRLRPPGNKLRQQKRHHFSHPESPSGPASFNKGRNGCQGR
ncbi:hypothetical protein MTO96_050730 [Rhipicephalus appendiculatus]